MIMNALRFLFNFLVGLTVKYMQEASAELAEIDWK